jgi:hypothetical protein
MSGGFLVTGMGVVGWLFVRPEARFVWEAGLHQALGAGLNKIMFSYRSRLPDLRWGTFGLAEGTEKLKVGGRPV